MKCDYCKKKVLKHSEYIMEIPDKKNEQHNQLNEWMEYSFCCLDCLKNGIARIEAGDEL